MSISFIIIVLFIIFACTTQHPVKTHVKTQDLTRKVRQSGGWNGGSPNNGALDDSFVFEDDIKLRNYFVTTPKPLTTAKPVAVPGMGTARSACENRCQTTPEYNPVCADNNITYFSLNRLKCAQKCGKRINVKYFGACPRF